MAGASWPFSTTRAAQPGDALVHDSSLDLLEAATNPDPNPAKGSGGVLISEGTALMSGAGARNVRESAPEEPEQEADDEERDQDEEEEPEPEPEAPAAPVASGFSDPVPAGRLSQGIHGNNGVDFSAPQGSSILAAAGGTVSVARSSGWNGGYGNYVVIDHGNGLRTLYAHMTDTLVSEGESVGRGELIGTVGNTGQSTGYHLHFEVKGGRNPFAS